MSRTDEIMKALDYYVIPAPGRRDPTEEDLADFEQRIGGALPGDYRDFLRRYGLTGLELGARFDIREPSPWGTQGSLDMFLGFSSKPDQDIVHQTLNTFAGRIPDETIPFARDAGGNLLVLGFDGPAKNRVWFWDHEHRELGEKIDTMRAEVSAKGTAAERMDDHTLLWHWERLYPERLSKPAGYGNLYAVADTFMEFLESLRPETTEEG